MCKVGCNWSEALAALLIDKRVCIDYIKAGAFGEFGNQFDQIRSLKPILMHGLCYNERTGMQNIECVDFQRANLLIARCGSPHYGLHLAISTGICPPTWGTKKYTIICARKYRNSKRTCPFRFYLKISPNPRRSGRFSTITPLWRQIRSPDC